MVRICNCAVLAVLLILSSVSLFASTDQSLATDQVRNAIAQPDGASVSLQAVFVDDVIGSYEFVRDTFGGRVHCSLPVYLKNFVVKKDWTLDITGIMATVGSKRVLIAREISIYTDVDGKEFCVPFPFRAGDEWPYIKNAEAGISMMDADPTLPPVPEPQPTQSQPLTASPGTVAYVKLNGDEVDLTGKLVTAVFYNNDSVSFFYIQEPVTGGNGIKVVPQVSIPVEPGSIVTIKGNLISGESSGEAYIYATSVKCTGSMKRPGPAGMSGRSVVGGEFGEQPALYLNTSSESPNGGLNPVGTRVRVWGNVLASATENGHAVRYISDGSGLITSSHTGLKVVYWNPSDAPGSQTYIQGVTGVLGAEIADGKPVPVVRVPDSTKDGVPGCIKYVTPGGVNIGCWTNCYSSVQAAINAANGCEIWVAAGTYNETTTLSDGTKIYGGFAGGETLREERNWSAHETILDGTNLGNTVVYMNSNTRIDGFTVQGGSVSFGDGGGGIAVSGNNAVIINNKITGNYAGYANAGGIYTISDSVLICNNVITGNTTTNSGGGICCFGNSSIILCNEISGNTAGEGGGIVCSGSVKVLSNNIIDNTATSKGGGISCGNDSIVSRNTIKNNNANCGGGVYSNGGRVANNAIIENTCSTAGAGIYSDISCAIINNTIAWNGDENAGDGICLIGTSATYRVINNILAYNYGAGIRGVSGINIDLKNNDSVGHGQYNYVAVGTVDSSNISVAPAFETSPAHNIHLQATSPCINMGLNSFVNVGELDIDGDARITDSTVDIGADETTGCTGYIFLFSPKGPTAAAGTSCRIYATVKDPVTCGPVSGVKVTFTIDAGLITAISPDGHIDQGQQSGYGTTGSDGKVYVEVRRDTPGYINVNAAITVCSGTSEESARVRFVDESTDDWPMFQHDPAHTGCTLTSLGTNLVKKWVMPLNGTASSSQILWSSPVVSGGIVYVGTDSGTLYAFDANYGTQIAAVNLGYGFSIYGTPCVADGKVYVGTYNGVLHVYNAADITSEDWTKSFGECISGGMTVYGGAVYFGTESAKLHTINTADHVERLGSPASTKYGVDWATPGIDLYYEDGERCYIGDSSCAVMAARCSTGEAMWPLPGWQPDMSHFNSSPTPYNGYIFGGSTSSYVYRIIDGGNEPVEPEPPEPLYYSISGNVNVNSTVAACNGNIYFGTLGGNMYCVDANSFSETAVWTTNLGSPISSSALISTPTGLLFTCTQDGKVHALDIDDGSDTLVYDTSIDIPGSITKSSPAASNGKLYIVVGNNVGGRYLYCFGP